MKSFNLIEHLRATGRAFFFRKRDMPPPKTERLNRKAWKAQHVLSEVAEWHTWVSTSIDNFNAELKALAKTADMPAPDVANLIAVQEELAGLKTAMRPLERAVRKATGQRIRRAKKKTP